MAWGHPRVIIAVGKNKIVKDLDEAFQRVKNVIVPEHTRKRGASGPPCSTKGKCYDCIGRKRVCNVMTIMEGSPALTELNVVIVDEDLGLGWDPSWPEERIHKILENHRKFIWSVPRRISLRAWTGASSGRPSKGIPGRA